MNIVVLSKAEIEFDESISVLKVEKNEVKLKVRDEIIDIGIAFHNGQLVGAYIRDYDPDKIIPSFSSLNETTDILNVLGHDFRFSYSHPISWMNF